MKVIQMPPVHGANLVTESDNIAYAIESIVQVTCPRIALLLRLISVYTCLTDMDRLFMHTVNIESNYNNFQSGNLIWNVVNKISTDLSGSQFDLSKSACGVRGSDGLGAGGWNLNLNFGRGGTWKTTKTTTKVGWGGVGWG